MTPSKSVFSLKIAPSFLCSRTKYPKIFNKSCKSSYIRSICRQQPFRSLRAHQYSSDQMKILKDQSAQTTARVVSVAYRFYIMSSINALLAIILNKASLSKYFSFLRSDFKKAIYDASFFLVLVILGEFE